MKEIRITNSKGLEVTLLDYGARIISVRFRIDDRLIEMHEYYADHERYVTNRKYSGATIGPLANRLALASFNLNGDIYQFTANEGDHWLHSGSLGFHNKIWTVKEQREDLVVFEYETDFDGLYTGRIKAYVTFSVTMDNALLIQFEGISDRPTFLNMTSHGYFNLRGSGDLSTHRFKILADQYAELNDEKIPTGMILPVKDTLYDLNVLGPN